MLPQKTMLEINDLVLEEVGRLAKDPTLARRRRTQSAIGLHNMGIMTLTTTIEGGRGYKVEIYVSQGSADTP